VFNIFYLSEVCFSNVITGNIYQFTIFVVIQTEFDESWDAGHVTQSGWDEQLASDNAILGYKLLVQTGDPDSPIDKSRVHCIANATTCNSVRKFWCHFLIRLCLRGFHKRRLQSGRLSSADIFRTMGFFQK